LLITSAVTLLVANIFDLSSLSTMGSAGFLLIFAGVNLANAKLSEQTKSIKTISYIGAGLCIGALISLLWQTITTEINHLWIFIGMIFLSVSIEASFRLFTKREMKIN
jgi:hypothetical protein